MEYPLQIHLRPIRKMLNLSQEAIAALTGINRKTYTAYENGTRGKRKIPDHFYRQYLDGTGIDLHLTIAKGHTIIINPQKLPPEKTARLLQAGAEILEAPIAADPAKASNIQ